MIRAKALTIAGSDSSGGAGVQADLKTMAAFGVFGASALTCVTVQNTLGVYGVVTLDPDVVSGQIDAVLDDVGADAAKTGMLATVPIIEAVAERVSARGVCNLVVDTVMRATSGAALIDGDAVDTYRRLMLPLATIITPNILEAETLSGRSIDSDASAQDAARALNGEGAAAVLITGGHASGDEAVDLYFDGTAFERLSAPRIAGGERHGTGCTLSAAIASGLALGLGLFEAVSVAKRFVTRAIESSPGAGKGSLVLDHTVRPDLT